ncbi:MAG TPA: serine hydrolase [Gemmatimonadaceae bacterium]|nr:serine hydrolase [Gemmatimonadaceae bacterium]
MSALFLALLVTTITSGAQDDSLAARIQSRIAEVPGARVGVAYVHLGRPDSLFLHADSAFHAASTMKVPVMIELFRRVDAGQLSLDQRILLVNQFGSIVDGSPYSLDPGDDSDSAMYDKVGERVAVGELLERMITRSSNLATNAVIALLGGGQRVTETMRSLGAAHIQVRRGVEDGKAYERGLNNTTTARDLAVIMRAIALDRAASRASSERMREILLRQEFNDEIPAGVPAGTPVAHKTGSITATLHDAGIVYPRGSEPYVLVILTAGIPDEKVARALMVDISRLVYAHATGEGA